MGDKKVCDNVCLCRCEYSAPSLCPEKRVMEILLSISFLGGSCPQEGQPHSQKFLPLVRKWKLQKSFYSGTGESQMFSVQNNLHIDSEGPNGSPHH